MHVGCPSCGTKYVLPPNKAQAGLKVRCKRCSVVFSPPIAGEAGQGGERGKTGRGMPGAPKAAGGEETAPAAPAEEASDPTSEGSAHPTGISEPEEGPGKAENPWGGVRLAPVS